LGAIRDEPLSEHVSRGTGRATEIQRLDPDDVEDQNSQLEPSSPDEELLDDHSEHPSVIMEVPPTLWTSPDLVESHSLLVLSGSECSFEGCRTDVA
jgi:hypothetical protein